MNRLNNKRLKNQDIKANKYSKDDTSKILTHLNEKRLSTQKYEEIKKKRTDRKKVYKLFSKEYYEFMHMKRKHYIEIEDGDKISSRSAVITLFFRTFYELQKKISFLRQKSILINFSSYIVRYVFTSKIIHLKTTGR